MKKVTDELDSSDDEQGKPIEEIAGKRNLKKYPDWKAPEGQNPDEVEYQKFLIDSTSSVDQSYKPSYILSEISNRLLYSPEVTKIYDTVKDPLELEKQRLFTSIRTQKHANLGVKQEFDECINIEACKGKLEKYGIKEEIIQNISEGDIVEYRKGATSRLQEHLGYDTKAKHAQTALDQVIELQNIRNELATELKAAFPFIPRMPSEAFIAICKDKPELLGSNKAEIAKKLAEYRYKLKIQDAIFKESQEFKDLCNFFKIESTTKSAPYAELLKKIEDVIGRYPADHEIQQYQLLTNQQERTLEQVAKVVHDKVQEKLPMLYEYIDKKKSLSYEDDNGFMRTYQDILRDQQDAIAKLDKPNQGNSQQNKINFLAQVRANRKFNRAAYKDATIESNFANQRHNLPPGRNTQNTLYHTGSMSHWLGEFGGYQELAKQKGEELLNYKKNITVHEKPHDNTTNMFRNVSQIEALRNPSALLTNAMFFDLVEKGKLKIIDLSQHIPMAKKDTVPGAVYLEHSFKDHLSSRLPYDYRDPKDQGKTASETLVTRDNNILHQWLVETKLENAIPITDINNAIKETDTTIQSVNNALGDCTVKYFDKDSKEITTIPKEQYKNTKIADISKITVEHNGYSIELDPEIIIKVGQWESERKFEQDNDVEIGFIKGSIANQCNARGSNTKKGFIEHFEQEIEKKKNGSTVQYFDKDGKQIIDTDNIEIKTVHKIKIEKNGQFIELEPEKIMAKDVDRELFDKLHSNLLALSITGFPVAVFNELSEEWYGVTLPYLAGIGIGDLRLKAAAEPQEPDFDPDQNLSDPVTSDKRASQGELEDKMLPRGEKDNLQYSDREELRQDTFYHLPFSPLTPKGRNPSSVQTDRPRTESRVSLFPNTPPDTPNQKGNPSTSKNSRTELDLMEHSDETLTTDEFASNSEDRISKKREVSESQNLEVELPTDTVVHKAQKIGQELQQRQAENSPKRARRETTAGPESDSITIGKEHSRSPSPGFD